ncbi:hypothetical protein JYU03_00140 [bacterium AH-315-F03]|nr:hypothetical protein [bacterium AH-315-F03]
MNTKALKDAEKRFLKRYPGGFTHPEIVEIGKKHKMVQLEKFAKDSFAKKCFDDTDAIISDIIKLVSRSSMISIFEKPKFRDMANSLAGKEKELFVETLYELLHGKKKAGFEALVDTLGQYKLAKWTFATVLPAYYNPQKELLVKPNTTKLIIQKLELDVAYHPKPTWEFYRDYRKIIMNLKTRVNKTLSPNNPAFCGFLMMTLGD